MNASVGSPAGARGDRKDGEAVLGVFDRDVLAANGRVVRIRPSRASDLDALRLFYERLSDRSTYQRFFGLRPVLFDERLHPPGGNDIRERVVMLALDHLEVIGIGEYSRVRGRDEAEVAFAVADSHQHEGIATVLLEDLALIAREAGFRCLVAETLAGNDAMQLVFRTVGLSQRTWYEQGQVYVELDLAGEELLEDNAEGRDWTAAVASLRPLFSPSHIVVIGAGRDPSSVGRILLSNLVSSFPGRVSVVHPTEKTVGGVPAVAHVADLDAVADLAMIVVPAANVVCVADECGRAGVAAVVVISAGFAETGGVGVNREHELLATARRYGMRVLGPNCLGLVSTHLGLNATFMRQSMTPGSIAIASQSGGIGIVLAAEVAHRRLGVSSFVSLGNKVDISGNDVLRYWADDPSTSVVLMYLESIGDPRRFARVARAVSRRVPIVALKSGRSEAGKRGARSHTGALATDDVAIDALFAHTGVVRANTLDQMLDVAALLAGQPAPSGRRVALVGNAGGPLVLAADSASANGLDVVELSAELQHRLRVLVPDAASTSNPVDLLATVNAESMHAVLGEIAASGEVDACAVVSVNLGGEAVTPWQLDWTDTSVPAVAVLLGGLDATGTMPTYPTPERAMDALGLAATRGTWLATTADERITDVHVDLMALRRQVRHSLPAPHDGLNEPAWLTTADTFGLLETLGIPIAPWAVGRSGRECVQHAQRLGFPCVLKADVVGVVHKSDESAVVLGVASAAMVRRVVSGFRHRFGDRLRQVVVQQQAEPGVEMLIGAVRDPAVGPMVVVAAGGTEAELLGDRSVLLAPLTAARARWALERLRTFPRLRGFRGRPAVPVDPLVDIIGRIGLLMATVPEIVELDLNPVIAASHGCVAVDARVAVAPHVVYPMRAMRQPHRPSGAPALTAAQIGDHAPWQMT